MISVDYDSITYQGDGVTTAFPFSFPVYDATVIHLILVDEDGNETELESDFYVDTVNSTVYYPGYAPGSEPPLADQPPKVQTGEVLVVYRETEVTQESDLGSVWPFNVIELALDKLTMILQERLFDIGRCLKVRISDGAENFDSTITPVAGMALQVNSSGTGFECSESPASVLIECETARDTAVNAAGTATTKAGEASASATTASTASNAAVQANNSVQGAVTSADALLAAVQAYISAATVSALWDVSTAYTAGDVCMTSDGSTWRCIQDNTGENPISSPSYWAQITNTELYTFEYDGNGDLMPRINPVASAYWDLDANTDIMPVA